MASVELSSEPEFSTSDASTDRRTRRTGSCSVELSEGPEGPFKMSSIIVAFLALGAISIPNAAAIETRSSRDLASSSARSGWSDISSS